MITKFFTIDNNNNIIYLTRTAEVLSLLQLPHKGITNIGLYWKTTAWQK